jgi:hypothetical protein
MSLSRKLAKFISNYSDPQSIGSCWRTKRIVRLIAMVEEVFAGHGAAEIVDIGGMDTYWKIMPADFFDRNKVRVTVVNVPSSGMPEDYGPFTFVQADETDLAIFPDRRFHIAHSNSVVEHVGDWSRMALYARELARVSQRYYVQTPNYWFPMEPHCMPPFFQMLPKPLRVWLVLHFQLGHWPRAATVDAAVRQVERARLLEKRMFQALFPDAVICTERLLGLPRSFVAVKG